MTGFGAVVGVFAGGTYLGVAGLLLIFFAPGGLLVGGPLALAANLAVLTIANTLLVILLAGYLVHLALAYVFASALTLINPTPLAGPVAYPLPLVVVYLALDLLIAVATLGVVSAGVPAGFIAASMAGAIGTSSIVGAVAIVLLVYFVMMLGHFIVIGIVYTVAAIVAPATGPGTPGELFCRGVMIGFNAAANFLLGAVFFPLLFTPLAWLVNPLAAGFLGAFVLAVINLLAVVMPTGSPGLNAGIRGLLGWTAAFMPMSWLVTPLGAIFFTLTWLGHALFSLLPANPGTPVFVVKDLVIEWATGTILTNGGIAGSFGAVIQAPVRTIRPSFNMGCFVFHSYNLSPLHVTQHREHEPGHGLLLAAGGSHVHYAGAINETWQVTDAYAERLAESRVSPPLRFKIASDGAGGFVLDQTRPTNAIDMWLP